MSQPFLGEIEFFAFSFPPKNWMTCAGQLLSVNQNQALFALLGTTFGGDGRNTFALPDLRGRLAIGQGQGHSLDNYTLGQQGGEERVTLTADQIPAHTHAVMAVGTPPATPVASPSGNLLSVAGNPSPIKMYGAETTLSPMAAGTVADTGNWEPHENRMPYLALNPCIAVSGLFPSRP